MVIGAAQRPRPLRGMAVAHHVPRVDRSVWNDR